MSRALSFSNSARLSGSSSIEHRLDPECFTSFIGMGANLLARWKGCPSICCCGCPTPLVGAAPSLVGVARLGFGPP